MAGTTTNFAIPYPSITDYVADGATAMRTMAEQVDAVLFTGSSSGNLLINGAMQVAQRGTSTASITASNYYTADRWKYAISSLGTWTQTVENDAPTGSGFRKSMKYLCTTADASPAAGDLAIHHQIVEGQNLQAIRKGTASAQQVTVSFWVKSNKTGTYICDIYDEDNSRGCSKSYTISASGTWEYKSLTFPADTTGAFNNDADASAQFRWWLGAGSSYQTAPLQTAWAASSASVAAGQVNLADTVNNYWQITGVQATVGAVATPFEFKSYADDLRACQRYYWRTTSNATNTGKRLIFAGQNGGSTSCYGVLVNPVPLRAPATSLDYSGAQVSDSASWQSSSGVWSLLGVVTLGELGTSVSMTSATGVLGFANSIILQNNGSYIGVSASYDVLFY